MKRIVHALNLSKRHAVAISSPVPKTARPGNGRERVTHPSEGAGGWMGRAGKIEGEAAYQERKRAWETASQPLVPSRFPSHDRPQHRGPERGGPERDYGPSR